MYTYFSPHNVSQFAPLFSETFHPKLALIIISWSANIHHQGSETPQPLSVLPCLDVWEKTRFFQKDGLTEY